MHECSLCHEPIDTTAITTWKAVIGWVGGPKKDSMRLRQDAGLYAHDTCIQAMMAGQAPDQPTLFDLDAIQSQPYTSADSLDFLDDDDGEEWPKGPPIERRGL